MAKFWDDEQTSGYTFESIHFERGPGLSVRVTTNTSAASILTMGPGLLVGFATITQGPFVATADVFTGDGELQAGIRKAFRVAPRQGWKIDNDRIWTSVCQTVAQIIIDMAAKETRKEPPPPPPGSTRSAPDGLPWSALGLAGPIDRAGAAAAFRATAKRVHPDVAMGDGLAMQELLAAWETIKRGKGWR